MVSLRAVAQCLTFVLTKEQLFDAGNRPRKKGRVNFAGVLLPVNLLPFGRGGFEFKFRRAFL